MLEHKILANPDLQSLKNWGDSKSGIKKKSDTNSVVFLLILHTKTLVIETPILQVQVLKKFLIHCLGFITYRKNAKSSMKNYLNRIICAIWYPFVNFHFHMTIHKGI